MTSFVKFEFTNSKFKQVLIPINKFEANQDDWYIGLMIKNRIETSNENETITIKIHQNRLAALSVIYSMIYNKLVILKGADISLIKCISQEWAIPETIITEIDVKIQSQESIFICIICGVGYKKSENTKTSCQTHRDKQTVMTVNGPYFQCCGNKIDKPCCIGYHYSGSVDL